MVHIDKTGFDQVNQENNIWKKSRPCTTSSADDSCIYGLIFMFTYAVQVYFLLHVLLLMK